MATQPRRGDFSARNLSPLLLGLAGPVGMFAGVLGSKLAIEQGRREGRRSDEAAIIEAERAEKQRQRDLTRAAFPNEGDFTAADLPTLLERAYGLASEDVAVPNVLQDRIDELQGIGAEGRAEGRAAEQRERDALAAAAAAEQVRAQAIQEMQREQIAAIRDDLAVPLRNQAEATASIRNVIEAEPNFAGDAALTYGYARQLNPTGPLSETDVGAVANDPSIPSAIRRVITKQLNGQPLNETERAMIRHAAVSVYQNNQQSFEAISSPYRRTAEVLSLDWAQIVGDVNATPEELAPFLIAPPRPGTAPGAPAPQVVIPPAGTGERIPYSSFAPRGG